MGAVSHLPMLSIIKIQQDDHYCIEIPSSSEQAIIVCWCTWRRGEQSNEALVVVVVVMMMESGGGNRPGSSSSSIHLAHQAKLSPVGRSNAVLMPPSCHRG